ncbi:BaiN/RdsA family NAD(P)/FAD-dependent oxidoreductase [cyanobacterium endosymbiont of Epithemia clementina EcSB]|uniref:NAD(P)/FAD-dependent oxidoreductase n=1 Tax=cyanobacterium endosymbiont of Epithemia clementina EcSB TaxID=3034674 RepID=UPI00247FB863|nr:NAD(P)/FAD-dependent oxidoreductase [cyanobacterium endosymbiont of Epithemia clementina EcSB]WGT66710.1 NAD(P)/FAD-dependent oxidoreductase [cyanobacterium endosymbiont of Epithemia clementina EcSB]
MSSSLDIIVIGGGAAGFFAAITCAQTHPHSRVTLLESTSKVLTKVRIAGGGRCNVTHHCFEPAQLITYYPRGGRELRGAFTRFQPKDLIEWFESQGVALKTETDGRVFPVSDTSETIVDCLIKTAKKAKVNIDINSEVINLIKKNNHFQVELKTGKILKCDRILVATGSNKIGYQLAKSLGHEIILPIPSLFTFKIKDFRFQGLEGIGLNQVGLKLLGTEKKQQYQQSGSFLITHWGISGFGVLKLSAFGAKILHKKKYNMSLLINFLFPDNTDEVKQKLLIAKSQNQRSNKLISSYPLFNLPKRLWKKLLEYANIDCEKNWSELSQKETIKLAKELTQGQYEIIEKGVFKDEFVTCGGVNLKEINFKTMESKVCPHLYLAGEVLDIDGVTGGFNLQSAWTTGWLAGKAIGNK